MIVDAIVGIFLGIVTLLLGLVPEWTVSIDAVETGAGWAGQLIGTANRFIPLREMLVAVSIVFVFVLAIQAWAAIVWIWERLPVKSS